MLKKTLALLVVLCLLPMLIANAQDDRVKALRNHLAKEHLNDEELLFIMKRR